MSNLIDKLETILKVEQTIAMKRKEALDQIKDLGLDSVDLVKRYDKAFEGFTNLRPAQPTNNRNLSGHHLYLLRINFNKIEFNRNELMKELKKGY